MGLYNEWDNKHVINVASPITIYQGDGEMSLHITTSDLLISLEELAYTNEGLMKQICNAFNKSGPTGINNLIKELEENG
tara:strand:+ start:307 stop:543 length:237 start_codon:yes stop_codon:yes gene_type:complete